MNNLRKYISLLNKMLNFRTIGDEKAEDEVLRKLDHHWLGHMDQVDQEKVNSMIFFDSKEKYIAFQQAWKQFMKEGKHRKRKIPHEYNIWNDVSKKWELTEVYTWKSDLCAEHHVLYGILRNKKLKNMFTPTKVPEGYPPSNFKALNGAAGYINWVASHQKQEAIEHLLKPFNNTLDIEDIKKASLRLKKIADKTSNFRNLELE